MLKTEFEATFKTDAGRDGRIKATASLKSLRSQPYYFAVTGTMVIDGQHSASGCIHDDIAKHIPELAPFIKWHLCSVVQPMYYVKNSLYHASKGNVEAACASAIWPEATLKDFTEISLLARLPLLMAHFRLDMRHLFSANLPELEKILATS